ncbi:MAG: hypothetical protein U0174_22965 [Polyangiaceae bacterium]
MNRITTTAVLLGLVSLFGASSAHATTEPFRSMKALPSSNGYGAIAWDRATQKVNQFMEHPYRYPAAGVESRNFAYDSYPGVRVGSQAAWLNTLPASKVSYVPGTGIIQVDRTYEGVALSEFHFAPMGLAEKASVMLLRATRVSGTAPIDAYALFNFHLGAGSPTPGANAEQALYVASRDAIYEWGPSGVAFAYGSIGASSFHGMSPNNPFASLTNAQNLANNDTTGGALDDVATGFQKSLGSPSVGASAWAGFYVVLDPGADAQAAADRVRTWIGARDAAQIYADEVTAWNAWHKPTFAGLSPSEADLAKQSAAVLRMAQVRESGAPNGQMLASLATGRWNIAWVRDMAYAVVGLVRTGHYAEAKAAILFQLKAEANQYKSYVANKDYKISVVRYYGNGKEETDFNEDGPNIEFDGFGLFLWELEEYIDASGDTGLLTTEFGTVSSGIADVLLALQEPGGLIAPDSSIWEVHWNGKQRHFAYTSITAARGLCGASRLATKAGNAALGATYMNAGIKARDAVFANMRTPAGALAQSTEGLAAKTKFLDASVVEAMNFGLVFPDRRTARATMESMVAGLVPPSGRGFMRSDIGAWYDSQEWVFVDFRSTRALGLLGDVARESALHDWNLRQAQENFGLFSELHERTTSEYVGEAPMVGFGAGSYLLSLSDRGKPSVPTCGAFPDEPPNPSDAGASDSGPLSPIDGGKGSSSGGNNVEPRAEDDGCAMHGAASSWSLSALLAGLATVAAALVRKSRRPS